MFIPLSFFPPPSRSLCLCVRAHARGHMCRIDSSRGCAVSFLRPTKATVAHATAKYTMQARGVGGSSSGTRSSVGSASAGSCSGGSHLYHHLLPSQHHIVRVGSSNSKSRASSSKSPPSTKNGASMSYDFDRQARVLEFRETAYLAQGPAPVGSPRKVGPRVPNVGGFGADDSQAAPETGLMSMGTHRKGPDQGGNEEASQVPAASGYNSGYPSGLYSGNLAGGSRGARRAVGKDRSKSAEPVSSSNVQRMIFDMRRSATAGMSICA